MENISIYVAVYGAVLSTFLALAKLITHLLDRPNVSIFLHNSEESWPGNKKSTITLSNIGSHPIVITRLIVEFFNANGKTGELIEKKTIDHRDLMDPALKSIPVEGARNTSRRVPNVIYPGSEYFAYISEPDEFDPTAHQIKVTAQIRNSSRKFVGWGEPVTKEAL